MAQLKRDLTTGNITRNLLSFSFPVFLSCFLQALYGNADAIIVGQFATLGDIAGVTQGSQVMNIVTQMISGLSTSGSILIGQYMGARKEKDLEETVATLFSVFLVSALLLTGLMLVGNDGLATLLHLSEEAKSSFVDYMRISEVGMVFIFLYNAISAVLHAMGESKKPLLFVLVASIINITLDLLLVGSFHMGAKGAATATIVAQMVSVLLSIVYLRKNHFFFTFTPREFRIRREKVAPIFRLGFPYMIQRFLVYSSFSAISGLANIYGLEAGSAAGIVAKINTFATLPFSAFQVGISTCTAQNVGAGNIDRAKKCLSSGVLLCLTSGGAMFILCFFFPRLVLSVFSSNEKLIEMGIPFLQFYALEYLFMPFSWPIHGFFSGCGNTLIPAFDGILASVVFRTPLALLFSQTLGMGYPGIALGASVAVWGAIPPAWTFYALGVWKKSIEKKRNRTTSKA